MPPNTEPGAYPVSPLFQLILIIISIICIMYFINRGLARLLIKEPSPAINVITPDTVKQFGNFPEVILVGLYVEEFQKFDIIKGSFIFSGMVWFLANPAIISIETLSKFSFEQGTILSRGDPKITILDKNLLVQFPVKVDITNNLDYVYFPIDDHRVYFILNNTFISPTDRIFNSSQREFVVKQTAHTFGWELLGTTVTSGYDQSVIDEYDAQKTLRYARIVFAMDFSRYGTRYILSILLPLLLIFYLTLFCFSIMGGRTNTTLAAGSITAILAYRFVIESLSPAVGYFMLSDYLFFLFLGASFTIFFLTSFEHFATKIPLLYKKIIIIFLHSVIIGTTAYLFLYW